MKILLVHQFFLGDHEGGGVRWNEMCRIWTKAGHEVLVICGAGHYMEQNASEGSDWRFQMQTNKDGVKVINCPRFPGNRAGYYQKLLGFISYTFCSIWAGIFYATEKYDLILVSSPPLFVGFTGIVLSRIKRIPLLFEVRDLWPESAIETGVLKNKLLISLAFSLERLTYRNAKKINVLTPVFRKLLISRKKVPPEKIICIPNAADFTIAEEVNAHFDRQRFRQKHGLNKKFVIVYVGAHGIANHLIQILETAELVRDTNACFLLIGNGEEKPMLQNEARRMNLNNVRFIDKMAKKEIFEYIIASEVGLSVLQNREIFKTIYSNKTFDYFSCRKPVLMAIDGISRKLVEDADAGIFVEPENPADFARKIRYCMQNQDILESQGENGYNHAKQYFDREVLAKRYLQYIGEL